jgi:multidrug resistance efflux pump
MKKVYIPILVLTILLTACTANSTPTVAPDLTPAETSLDEVVAEGKLLPAPSVELAFAQPGIVDEVFVQAGQEVAAGKVIARLQNIETMQAEVARAEEACLLAEQAFGRADAETLSALAAANEAVRVAQYEFDNFDIPSDLRDMTTSEALVYTHTNLETAREAFEPYKYLEERLERELRLENPHKPKVYRDTAKIYKKRLDDAWADYNKAIQWAELEANLESAKVSLKQAQRELTRLQAGENAEEAAIARAQYESALANLEAAHAALAGYELRAPFDGRLLSLDLTAGESVLPGLPVAFIGDTGQWQVETTDLAEIDIANVALGDPVLVKLDAFPGEEFPGKVVEIDPVGREYLGDMTYKVTVLLDTPDERFKWNMTAIVSIGEN